MKKTLWFGMALLLACGTLWAQQYVITTVAGGGQPPTGIAAVTAQFSIPYQVATDTHGNVYFSAANCVFKVDGSGIVTRVAGSRRAGYTGDGGAATNASLNQNRGVAVDAAGNLYIADTGNSAIRRVTAGGTITTVAGAGAQLNSPYGLAVDAAGNLYIADFGNNNIRKMAGGAMSTIAGTGGSGYSGDGGAATSARLSSPFGVAVDASGDIYIADSANNVVRKVAGGIITTVAGTGARGYSGDGGPATAARLASPYSVAVDAAGVLYIADDRTNTIRKVAADGTITTIAGNHTAGYSGDGGPATSAQIYDPRGVALGPGGVVYIADTSNNRIRAVAADGTITTVAGNGGAFWGAGGAATNAQFYFPSGLALDAAGDLYIADTSDHVVLKVAPNGIITSVAGTGIRGYSGDGGAATAAELGYPWGLARDGAGNLYITDIDQGVVRKVAADGSISTAAGAGGELYMPEGVAVDGAGNLYIADTFNNLVRKVDASGVETTVAGTGAPGWAGDGGPATSAQLYTPAGVALDAAGNLYIVENNNNTVRKVTANGMISTVAGNGTAGSAGDGGPATAAQLSFPAGVAVDSSGNLYIADHDNSALRKVAADGTITTLAGIGRPGYSGDGGPSTGAALNYPNGVAVDSAGRVYVADNFNNAVRMLTPQGGGAVVSVTLSHSGGFVAGQAGATYSVVVSNAAGAGATNGTVTLTETVPVGLTLISMAGAGWTCTANACTRGDALSAGSSYPPVTVTVNVAGDAPLSVINQVGVAGGGAPGSTAGDLTAILAGPAAPVLSSPANGASGAMLAPTLVWNAAVGAASYDVYFGTSSTPPLASTTAGTSYGLGTLSPGTTYYWQIAARNAAGTASSAIQSFATAAAAAAPGLRFVPVASCRAVDTRNPAGAFGGPTMEANSARSFAIPQSGCGVPASAKAYSLNVTALPDGPLSYLSMWPTGQSQAVVSTLNSFNGSVVANAGIVQAGSGGAVTVYVTDVADVILDINGYFDSSSGPTSYAFYPSTPCRVADTRDAVGQFGGPTMYASQSRDFPIPLSPCGIPATARAYSMNFTVVPGTSLGYLTTWATGGAVPEVSTLKSWTGKVLANAAVVPAGTNESVSVFVSDPTDVIMDVNGYFAAPGSEGALSFYPVTPCRVADTRTAEGPLGGPTMEAGSSRSFSIPASGCRVAATAAAYSVNITVVPQGVLNYLTAWPTGSAQPLVSTLNSFDGSVVANAAIIPAGAESAISLFVTNPADVVLDINGYFAP
jgi:uncharacterized repeat protein (TIGR01451 family)